MSILNFAPTGYTLMPSQISTLLEVESVWDDVDVIILDTPTGGGKSVLALTIMGWQGGGSYIVPNNALLKQITDEFPYIPSLQAQDRYLCSRADKNANWTCQKQIKTAKAPCSNCHMKRAQIKDSVSPYGVYTYFGLHSNYRHRNLVVVDEAHLAVPFLRGLHSKRLPKSQYNWPDPFTSDTLGRWSLAEQSRGRAAGKRANKALLGLSSFLQGKSINHILYRSRELIRGYMDDVINIVPAVVKKNSLWPYNINNKIVLMSATLSDLDILQLGLFGKRVHRVVAPNPIPPQNRQVAFLRSTAVTWENRQVAVQILAKTVQDIANWHPNESGIVHIPYSLAQQLAGYLSTNPRYIFHGKEDKDDRLKEFLSSSNGIFIASGFAEGLSLSYDAARFNVVCKAMFPNKRDPFVIEMTKKFPKWPIEQAISTILQSYGRTTRRPDDKSITYILDTMAWNLYKMYNHLWPAWFKDAVVEFNP